MSNPYIISMMKHPEPEPVIKKTYIDMRVTICGFDANSDLTEFLLDSFTPHAGNDVYPNAKEKSFCHRSLCETLYALVNNFPCFALFNSRNRLDGEDRQSLIANEWLIEVSAPDGTRNNFQGPSSSEETLSDYPEVFVKGCTVRAYTPLFVKYGFQMTEMGIKNLHHYQELMIFSSKMKLMDTNIAAGRDVQ